MVKVRIYFEEIFDELLNKVSWPQWGELQGSAIVMAVASVIISIIIYLMDTSFGGIMKLLYSIF